MNLSNKKIKDSYGGLLNIGLTGASPGVLYEVTDGMGNVLPIEISTTEVKFTGFVTGITGAGGSNGTSGTSGINGSSGTSGVNGAAGSSGTSGISGSSGTSGVNGADGSSGTSGISGSSGTSGISGATGSSGTSGINGADGSSGTSGINGAQGAVGATGAAGADGSSGTSGINGTPGLVGPTGATGPTDTTALVNVITSSDPTQKRISSGNLPASTTAGVYLSSGTTEITNNFLSLKGNSQVRVESNGVVWIGDNSTFNGQYSVLLGRNVSNNGTDGNVLIGFGAVAGGGSVRDSFAVGQSSLNGSVIGARYQDFTAAMGFQLVARQRNALNTTAINLSRLPGQFSWSVGSNAFVSVSGYANDAAFYANYVGRDATTPSGATAGSFYAQPGGNLMIAGSTGYNYVNPALDYADDTAAAAAGVAIGQIYHNSGAVKVRLT